MSAWICEITFGIKNQRWQKPFENGGTYTKDSHWGKQKCWSIVLYGIVLWKRNWGLTKQGKLILLYLDGCSTWLSSSYHKVRRLLLFWLLCFKRSWLCQSTVWKSSSENGNESFSKLGSHGREGNRNGIKRFESCAIILWGSGGTRKSKCVDIFEYVR